MAPVTAKHRPDRTMRTGFAYAAHPDQPLIDVRWDRRRGPVLTPRVTIGRVLLVILSAILWVTLINVARLCARLAG